MVRLGERPRRRYGIGRLEVARMLLAQKPWIVPVPGTAKLPRLEENLGAANVEMTSMELAEIQKAAAAIQIEGERYPEQLLKTTGL